MTSGIDPHLFLQINYELLLSLILSVLVIALGRVGKNYDKLRWVLVPLASYLGIRYLIWRGMHTLNLVSLPATAISFIVYLAEIYGFISMGLFYAQVLKAPERISPPLDLKALPTVDVFVTIYNESTSVLYKTLIGCLALDYPADRKKIYVLDDSHRADVRALAERLGCLYITRNNNDHAKSGNINNALPKTSGEFIMFLDCDHVPVRSFLKETLGFFRDPKVAFVQTPHYFYNSDTYQHNLRLEGEVVNEQDLFFYVIEPGKDASNSAFFAGSSGVFRRKPLVEIGGFQVQSLIEDMHTSMVLHSRGHKSIYLNKVLTGALSPESYRSYLKQRQRWTRGGIQVFLADNPLIKRGLSIMQRVNYFASIHYFFHGIPRLIYLVAPLSFLVLGIAPLSCSVLTLMAYFAPYYITALLAFSITSREFRSPFWSDVYESVVCFFLSGTAIDTLLRPDKLKFSVTPKGTTVDKAQLDWSYVLPHVLLLASLLIGAGIGMHHLAHATTEINATILSLFWSLYNAVIVSTAIVVARSRPQMRAAHRLPRRIACEVRFADKVIKGQTLDLSETGMSFIMEKHALLPQSVELRLKSDFGEETDVEGEVIRNSPFVGDQAKVGIRFVKVSEDQRQSIIRQLFSSPSSWAAVSRPNSTTWGSLLNILTASLRPFKRANSITRRFSPRIPKQLECEVVAGNATFKGMTEDISITGLSIQTIGETIKTDHVTVRIYPPGKKTTLNIRGEIVRRANGTGNGTRLLGIEFLERKDSELSNIV